MTNRTLFPLSTALALAFTITVSSPALADDADPPEASAGWTMSAGVSPTLMLLKGVGVEVDLKAPEHFRFFASAFTLVIPELFQRDNADEGWSIRDTGGGAGVQYHLRADGRGLYVGALLESQNHHIERMGQSLDALEIASPPRSAIGGCRGRGSTSRPGFSRWFPCT